MKKKGWVKPKEHILICGVCETCKKQLMSNMGGWIVTAKKKYFCHDGKEGSCFDNYCELNIKQHKEQHEKRLSQDSYW